MHRIAIVGLLSMLAACGGGGGGGGNPAPGPGPGPGPGPFLPGIAYIAEKIAGGSRALYAAALDGSQNLELSGTIVAGGTVKSFKWSPDGTRIAYLADRIIDEVFELYIVDPVTGTSVGAHAALVAGRNVSDISFAWSPDSSRIAYQADQDSDEVFELYVTLADGSGNVKVSGSLVSGGDVNSNFQWRPDSAGLAYIADQVTDDKGEVFYAAADGSGAFRLSSATMVAGGDALSVSWAPNGSRIAFVADQNFDNYYDVYSTLPDGSDNTRMTQLLYSIWPDHYRWAPDSSRIAFLLYFSSQSQLCTVPADGDLFDVVEVSGDPIGTGGVTDFEWAPDSSRLAYVSNQGDSLIHELYTSMPTSQIGNVKVSRAIVTGGDVPTINGFAWSPDSTLIAYHADAEVDTQDQLYVTLPTGAGGNVRMSGPLVAGGDVNDFYMPNWAPDGTRLAYIADQGVDNKRELFGADPAGGNYRQSGATMVGDATDFYGPAKWSTDSTRIAYIASQESSMYDELFTSLKDGSGNVRVSVDIPVGAAVTSFAMKP